MRQPPAAILLQESGWRHHRGRDLLMSDHEPAREWLAQGDAVSTGSLFDHIAREPGVESLQRVAPDTVVLSMSSTAAAELRTVFGQRLVIEPNNTLTPPM